MRKLMVLAAMLAMALVVASPATANTFVAGGGGVFDDGFGSGGFTSGGFGAGSVANDGSIAEGGDTLVVDASQVQVAVQTQTGDTNAAAADGSVAFAQQDLSIGQSQFNAGFGDGSDNDLVDDGIFDDFDSVILFGDFDNDGLVDDSGF